MNYRTLLLMAGLLSAASMGLSQQTTTLRNVPIKPTSPASGAQMYTTYCAVCHGASATGNGPASVALKKSPVDLTLLSQKNGGRFPAKHVNSVLLFGTANPAHGTSEMPIWGDLLPSVSGGGAHDSPIIHQRVSNLIDYLKTVQQ